MNIASLIFLVVLFVLMPRAALRTARQLRQAQADGTVPPRARMAISTMFALTVLWLISALNAGAMGSGLFWVANVGLGDVGLGVLAFALLLLAIPISRAIRSPEEERRRLVVSIAPRNAREFAIYALVAVMAGIAEESAYRGVAVWILTPIIGNIVPAMLLSATAFAVAHAVQGGKAIVVVFGVAIILHALVCLTNTLVIAMLVHTAYDLVAGYAAGRRAQALDAQDAARTAAGAAGAAGAPAGA